MPRTRLVRTRDERADEDEPDLDATLAVLTDDRRAWLRTSLEAVVPDHRWLARL